MIICEKLERSGERAAQLWHSPAMTRQPRENCHDSSCSNRDSDRNPPEYKWGTSSPFQPLWQLLTKSAISILTPKNYSLTGIPDLQPMTLHKHRRGGLVTHVTFRELIGMLSTPHITTPRMWCALQGTATAAGLQYSYSIKSIMKPETSGCGWTYQ